MSRIVYVNGAFVAEKDAQVSIFDRGYLFADGVYEVVPVCAGRLIDEAPFIARLDRSLRELEIAWPCSPEDYVAFHNELIRRNDLTEGMVYSQVTRGVADRDFAFPKGIKPAVIAGCSFGALVGAAYASGIPAKDIGDHARHILANRVVDALGVVGAVEQLLPGRVELCLNLGVVLAALAEQVAVAAGFEGADRRRGRWR